MAKILIFDDDNDSLNFMKTSIVKYFSSTSLFTTSDGENGLEMVSVKNPDILLLKMGMPKLDSLEFCRKLKANRNFCDIPVVFLIAENQNKKDRLQALKCGADAFLRMPVDESELIAQIRAMIKVKAANIQKRRDKISGHPNETGEKSNSLNSGELVFEAIQNERYLLRTLIDNIPYAIYVKDRKARKLIANNADIEIMNCNSEADYLGKTDSEIFGPEAGLSGYNEDMSVIHSEKPILNKENYYYDNDGKIHWRLISKYPLYDQLGKLSGLLGIGQDITGRKLADEALHESQALYHSFVEHLPVGVFRKDGEGRYVFVNSRFCKLKGLTAEEILGKTPRELAQYESTIESRRRPEMMGVQRTLAIEGADHHEEIMRTGKPIELEEIYPQPNGEIFYFQVVKSPVFSANGKVIGSQGIQFDITKRKLAEKALNESNEFNSSLLQTIPFGIDIVDRKGNVLFLNDKLIEEFGANAIGKKCWELYNDDHSQCKNCPLVTGIEIGEKSVYETERVFGGRIFQISHIGMLFNGKKAMLEVFQDITERKQSEIELIEAKEKAEESDRLKSAFLANMSHEIRTPLNCILGFTELLSEIEVEPDQRKEYSHLIGVSGNNLLSIINDIIDISKIEAGQIEVKNSVFSAQNLIQQLKSEFEFRALEKGIRLIIAPDSLSTDITIQSDETKIRQVLTNFISNALKFTDAGFIEIGLKIKGDSVQFQVKDTGIGISSKYHNQIFERFRQTESADTRKYGGNGLGLAISKSLIELLGGKIGVESEEGKGSMFYFSLPAEIIVSTSD